MAKFIIPVGKPIQIPGLTPQFSTSSFSGTWSDTAIGPFHDDESLQEEIDRLNQPSGCVIDQAYLIVEAEFFVVKATEKPKQHRVGHYA